MKNKYIINNISNNVMVDRKLFLKKLRQYWIDNTIPNISDVNTKFLVDLIKITKTTKMLEIWTANGFSTINFAIELEKVKWEILTIDFSSKSYDEALINFSDAWVEKTIKAILWNALDEIPKLENNYFDFIFIDGMMRRSKDFLELSWPKLKKWGVIIIDDVIKFKQKMVWLWEYLEEHKIEYNVLPIDEDDWVMMIVKWWKNINIFDKWNEIKKNIKVKEIFFHEGDIWNIYNWQNVWFEQNWKWNLFLRPVIIIKKFNNDMFWGVPFTTQEKKWNFFHEYFFNNQINFIIIPQLKLLSKKRLFKKMWVMKKKDFHELKQKTRKFLD